MLAAVSEESSEGGSGSIVQSPHSYDEGLSRGSKETNTCLKRLNRLTNSYDYIMFYTTTCASSGWCS